MPSYSLDMSTALYPGSFDPFHLGHLSVVEQVAPRVEHLVVAAVANPTKTGLLDLDTRAVLIARSVDHLPNVDAIAFEGLVADLVTDLGAEMLIRGLGEGTDELSMTAADERLADVETVMVAPAAGLGHIASRHIRAAVAAGRAAGLSNQVPQAVLAGLMGLHIRR